MAENNTQYGSPGELIPQMKEKLAAGEEFRLVVTGHSMSPTLIHLRDSVYISPLKDKLKKGDIVLVNCVSRCILHRVIKIQTGSFYTKGDALSLKEGPFTRDDVVGVVTRFERKGKLITVKSLRNRLCETLRPLLRKGKKLIYKLTSAIRNKKIFQKKPN